jgi:hypothetical protein
MPYLSRRTVLTSTAALAAGAGSAPAFALASSVQPSALLEEHRRRAERFFALEAHHQQLDDAEFKVLEETFPADGLFEEVEAAFAGCDRQREPRERQLQAVKSHVGAIDRRIWAILASTYDDILARAELAAFWNRGWGYTDHHGYEETYADKRLGDCVLIDRPARPSDLTFEPPALLLDYRRIQEEWCRDYPLCKSRAEQNALRDQHFEDSFEVERKLLGTVAPARSWSDIVVRAELTQYHRRNMLNTWAHFDNDNARRRQDCRLLDHRSYAELLTAILALGGVPRPPRQPYEDLLSPDVPDEDDDEV